jgi:hypothetical protein
MGGDLRFFNPYPPPPSPSDKKGNRQQGKEKDKKDKPPKDKTGTSNTNLSRTNHRLCEFVCHAVLRRLDVSSVGRAVSTTSLKPFFATLKPFFAMAKCFVHNLFVSFSAVFYWVLFLSMPSSIGEFWHAFLFDCGMDVDVCINDSRQTNQ